MMGDALFCGFLIVLILTPLLAHAQTNAPRRMEILAIGATMPQMTPVVSWFTAEPSTSVSHVPIRGYGVSLTAQEYQRAVRLYLPRTYEKMLDYDLFVYVGGSVDYISPSQIALLKRAVEEGGRGALGDLGGVSVTEEIVTMWISSGIWEIFPSDAPAVVATGKWGQEWVPFTVEILEGRSNNPLEPFGPLGLEKVTGNYGRLIIPREGSTIYGLMKGITFLGAEEPPFLVAWDYADGRTMLVAEFFNLQWFLTPRAGGENNYVLDVVVNMVLNALGKPVHQDIAPLHLARLRAEDFHNHFALILSVLDFVEKFGANTGRLMSELKDIKEAAAEAEKQYLNQEVEEAAATWGRCIERTESTRQRAMDLKDAALLWTYLIEWFAVMGTVAMCSTLLYTLMIRRRLYRETSATRLGTGSPQSKGPAEQQ